MEWRSACSVSTPVVKFVHSTSLFSSTHEDAGPFAEAIDTTLELGAYEALWSLPKTSFKSLAAQFAEHKQARPSDFVSEDEARETGLRVVRKLRDRLNSWFGLRLQGDIDYPARLRDATYPVELLYFQGYWDLLSLPCVAVVGTRRPTDDGKRRTRRLVKGLVNEGYAIVSGLAQGIDTEAHTTAIENDGYTVAVIGTPLGEVYPKPNAALQRTIAEKFLLISQVPVERYDRQNPRSNRFFFPERNKTMSALTQATVIVEAGETSGTLIQAREALRQKRQVFILNSCFEQPNLSWPEKFANQGAIRVREYDDIKRQLVHQAP